MSLFDDKVFKHIIYILCYFCKYFLIEGKANDLLKIRDRWLHLFGSLILGHGLYTVDDFGYYLTNM